MGEPCFTAEDFRNSTSYTIGSLSDIRSYEQKILEDMPEGVYMFDTTKAVENNDSFVVEGRTGGIFHGESTGDNQRYTAGGTHWHTENTLAFRAKAEDVDPFKAKKDLEAAAEQYLESSHLETIGSCEEDTRCGEAFVEHSDGTSILTYCVKAAPASD